MVVAVAIFAIAWWAVSRARAGNAKVRKARHDPHLDVTEHGDDPDDPQRDIPE
jgi:hypothetical protein